MKIKKTIHNGRAGWELSNGMLNLFAMEGGGHIAELTIDEKKNINPLWTPTWKSMEPWQYGKKDKAQYGCRLLSSICGHNLCLGAFGDPSPEETKAGLEPHGEASVMRWRCINKKVGTKQLTFTYGCELPIVRMSITRTITIEKDSYIAQVSEKLTNLAKCDVPFTMCQHVTFGAPFVEQGITIFDMSGTKVSTFPGQFSEFQRMKSSAQLTWPNGPGKKGKLDLRTMEKGKNSDFATVEMNRKKEHAWFSALNPKQGVMVAYIWKREDYPWTGIWEEAFARAEKPWNGKSLTRGLEFTNSPFPIGLRKSVDMGKLNGQPSYRWLPARSSLTFNYSIITIPIEPDCKGVASITPAARGFRVDLITD